MIDLIKISKNWLNSLRTVLADHPSEYLKISGCCEKGKYKEAYMLADEFLRKNNIEQNEEFQEADKDFYFSIR